MSSPPLAQATPGGQAQDTDTEQIPFDISPSLSRKFAIADILGDKSLAEAALQELQGGSRTLGKSPSSRHSSFKRPSDPIQPPAAPAAAATPAVEIFLPPDDHFLKLRETAEVLDEGVEEESQVNGELAQLIIKQLESSRSELENLADALDALGAAEAAYASALVQAHTKHKQRRRTSRVKDPLNLRPIAAAAAEPAGALQGSGSTGLETACKLPTAVLPIHQQVASVLAPMHHKLVHLVSEYSRCLKEVQQQAVVVQKAVDTARAQLQVVFEEHSRARASLLAALGEREAGRPAASPSVDPWSLERKLVQELLRLQRCQDKERSFLRTAFSHAKELEMLRISAMNQALSNMSDGYRAAVEQMQAALAPHGGMQQPQVQVQEQGAQSGDPDGTLLGSSISDHTLQELTRAAETASEATSGLSQKMSESIHAISTELFCSPEIIRQGELQSQDSTSGKWRDGHAVLTRAGCLYWFTLNEEGSPGTLTGDFNLARLQFEDGQAPCFHLVQESHHVSGLAWSMLSGSRPRVKLSFQAASVEECCEYAIAIREAIAVARGKQVS